MKTGISKTEAFCVICGPSKSRAIYEVIEHEYPETTDDIFFIHECLTCGLVFLNPRPSEAELSTIYPSSYFAFDLAKFADVKEGINVQSISQKFEIRRLRKLLDTHSINSPRSIYDIGCGDGSDLDLFRKILGPSVKTSGIEMSSSAVEKARSRGHDVQSGYFGAVEIDQLGFDLVISKHVIEHVADPLKFLMDARRLMSNDGVLIIDTPNVASPLRRIFRRHWGGWHTPRHWYLFSPKTFRSLAKSAKLEVVDIYFMPINTFWVWGLHSCFFGRNRKFADKFFDPVGINTAGISGVLLLSIFQIFEMTLKLFTKNTSQMRVVLKQSV